MRRLFFASAGVALLGLALGCKHMHGVCDCDAGDDPCCYYTAPTPVAAHGAPPPAAMSAAPAAQPAPTAPSREKLPAPTEKEK